MTKCLFLIYKESPLECYFFPLLFKGIQGIFLMDIPHVHKKNKHKNQSFTSREIIQKENLAIPSKMSYVWGQFCEQTSVTVSR